MFPSGVLARGSGSTDAASAQKHLLTSKASQTYVLLFVMECMWGVSRQCFPRIAFKGRGKRAEKREKREEKREKMFFSCFSWSAEGVFPKDSMTLGPSRWLAVAA